MQSEEYRNFHQVPIWHPRCFPYGIGVSAPINGDELGDFSEAIMTSETTPETEAPAQSNAAAAPADLEHVAPAQKNWIEWVVLSALVVVMLAQLWSSVVQLSITSDEVDHLHAAYRYWQCNDFGWNPEHPPLVKIVAGLPLQFMRINDPVANACGAQTSKAEDFVIGHAFLVSNPERMLMAARFAASSLALLLLLTVWFFARKMFGLPVAIIAGVLVAFEPNLLAHGALVTTDVAAALGMVLVIYATYNYVHEPRATRLLPLGLAIGFALCAKHSSILVAVIVPVLLFADAMFYSGGQRSRVLLRYAGALVLVAAVGLLVLWAAYGFRYAARPGNAAIWTPPRLTEAHGLVATRVIPEVERWRVLPEAYLVGLQDVLVESEVGRPAFLLGKLYRHGNWFYFPVVLVIKFTLGMLLMLVLSAISVRYWRRQSRELMFLLVPVVVYLGFSMRSGMNYGVRHVLPVFPFLIIFAAAGSWSFLRQRKWGMAALVALLLLHIASSLHAYPNYICYSNELWGGPANTYRYLANSDTDWGQAQKMARAYINKTRPENCFFLRTYNSKNSDYGIPCGGISELQWNDLQTPYIGTMIVSSSMVDGIGLRGAAIETRRVFKDLKPVAKLGGSALLVYQGTFDLSPLVAAQLLYRARELGEQDQQSVLELAQQAAQLDPSRGDAHAVMCGSYHVLGQDDQAEKECNLALALIRNDPKYGPEQIKYMEQFITGKGLKIYNNQ
jgi:4-amino-4-deoxy-L-arabinose transferase-like glycosyltransferase